MNYGKNFINKGMIKMKILWVFSGGMFKNGICVSQLEYYKRINKNKFEIEVLTIDASSEEMISEYREAGCKVHVLANKRKHLFKYINQLKKLFKKEKYDIIHVHGSSTLLFIELLVAKKCGIKVRIAHSRNTSCKHPFFDKLFQPIFKYSYNYALACGQDAGEWLFKNKSFIIVHNGKDLNRYKFNDKIRKQYRNKMSILDNELAFGHIGVFTNQKNHKFLIELFNQIYKTNKNVKLFLFGVGPNQEAIKELVGKLGLQNHVYFMGIVTNVQDYLQAMDIMLFPSLFEGLPNVVLEWQAAGLPSLISDKITQECAVCDLVKFLPIDSGYDNWLKEINSTNIADRNKNSKIGCSCLTNNGFEINSSVKKIEDIYLKIKR